MGTSPQPPPQTNSQSSEAPSKSSKVTGQNRKRGRPADAAVLRKAAPKKGKPSVTGGTSSISGQRPMSKAASQGAPSAKHKRASIFQPDQSTLPPTSRAGSPGQGVKAPANRHQAFLPPISAPVLDSVGQGQQHLQESAHTYQRSAVDSSQLLGDNSDGYRQSAHEREDFSWMRMSSTHSSSSDSGGSVATAPIAIAAADQMYPTFGSESFDKPLATPDIFASFL